jgi:peptide/nickel transport system permease protein
MEETTLDTVSSATAKKPRSQAYYTWKRLKRNKGSMAGLAILTIYFLLMLGANLLYDYKDVAIKQNIPARLQAPSVAHPFGTDESGRDVLARVIHGSRTSILISVAAVLVAMVIGGALGAIAGFYGERLSNVIMRFMDVLLAIPATLFAIVIVSALGTSVSNLIIACSVANIPKFARILRSSVMSVRNAEYIEAARALGARESYILIRHVLPNSISPLFVQLTITVGTLILLLSGMSFVGLGIQPPTPEWGAMLASARTYIRNYSYLCFFPGMAIMLCILSLNLLGDGLRDALDPRLK